MKKLFVVIIIFLILIGNIGYNNDFSLKDYFEGEYYAYSNSPLSENYLFLGSCYMNIGDIKEKNGIVGESMLIDNFEPISAIQELDANIIFTEYLDSGASVIYAFTNKISKYVKVDGEKINIQIAYYDDYSVIGWPLILGSF